MNTSRLVIINAVPMKSIQYVVCIHVLCFPTCISSRLLSLVYQSSYYQFFSFFLSFFISFFFPFHFFALFNSYDFLQQNKNIKSTSTICRCSSTFIILCSQWLSSSLCCSLFNVFLCYLVSSHAQ